MRKIALGMAVALSIAATPVLAEDRADLALRAVDAGFLPQIQTRLMDTLWPMAESKIREKLPNVDDAKLTEYKATIESYALDAAKYALLPMGVALAQTFDEAELQQLIAFYSSPAGQKLNSATSAITSVFVNEVTPRVNEQIPAFGRRVDELIAAEGGE